MGDFIEQLFEHHDRSQIEVVCYHDSVVDDDVSERLAAHASRWVKTSGWNDDELAARIAGDEPRRADRPRGHTGLRLRLLARRLAPVQATWLGYPATTGLSAIDFRLTDARADPPAHEALNSERLVRLPHSYFCYRPRDVAPLPGPLPALARGGEVTFGSFNIVAKISATTLELWAERAARGATLAAAAEGHRARVPRRCASGCAPSSARGASTPIASSSASG